jgi:hypothetical protein
MADAAPALIEFVMTAVPIGVFILAFLLQAIQFFLVLCVLNTATTKAAFGEAPLPEILVVDEEPRVGRTTPSAYTGYDED